MNAVLPPPLGEREKQFATLRARLALREFRLDQLEDDAGRPLYWVHRWAMSRSFTSLDDVEAFAQMVGA